MKNSPLSARSLPVILLVGGLAACGKSDDSPVAPSPDQPSQGSGEGGKAGPGDRVRLRSDRWREHPDAAIQWTQTTGPAVTLSDASVAEPTFMAPPVGDALSLSLGFRATITPVSTAAFAEDVEIEVQPAHFIVFKADPDGSNTDQLFSYRPDTHSVAELSGPVVAGGRIDNWIWSPNQRSIAYHGDVLTAQTDTAFVVQSDGTDRLQISQVPDIGGAIQVGDWSPDGDRFSFIGDVGTAGLLEAFSVLGTGLDLQVLAPSTVPGGSVHQLVWAPDSSRVLVRGQFAVAGENELYASNADGSGTTRLHPALPTGGSIFDLALAQGSDTVIFRGDVQVDGQFELFRAGFDGAGFASMGAPLVAGGDVGSFVISPDGQQIAYEADGDTDGVTELYTTRLDGTAQRKVSPVPVAGGDVDQSQWTSDSSRLVFSGDLITDQTDELFSVRPDGSGFTTISPALSATENIDSFVLSPDGAKVAMHYYDDAASVYRLAVARTDGVGGAQVLGQLSDSFIATLEWTPDSSRFFAILDTDSAGEPQFYSGRADGTDFINLNGAVSPLSEIYGYELSPNGLFLAFCVAEGADPAVHVYVVPLAGGPRLEVTPPGANVDPFFEVSWSRDGQWLAINGDAEVSGQERVWICTPTGADMRMVPLEMDPSGDASNPRWSFRPL